MKKARRLSEYRIARELGEAVCSRLVNACIRDLQRMGDEYIVAAYLQSELLTRADNWRNERISRYLARRYARD